AGPPSRGCLSPTTTGACSGSRRRGPTRLREGGCAGRLLRMERISVFGTGYLGATHAAGMAELGHEVIGVDVDEAKIARLQRGEVPFFEPGLPELLKKHVDSGRLRFTTDAAEAAEFADVHFIGVGTPQKKGEHAADMRF